MFPPGGGVGGFWLHLNSKKKNLPNIRRRCGVLKLPGGRPIREPPLPPSFKTRSYSQWSADPKHLSHTQPSTHPASGPANGPLLSWWSAVLEVPVALGSADRQVALALSHQHSPSWGLGWGTGRGALWGC